jgi:hypothetical protein
MESEKLNRSELRQKFKKLGLTKNQRLFYKVNGNSSNIVLKNFLETYVPPSKVNEYNVLRVEARKLGYEEKNGRKKDQLVRFIESKSRDIAPKLFKELIKMTIGTLKNEAMKLTTYEEKENVVDMEKGELIDFIRYKNRKKALKLFKELIKMTIGTLKNEAMKLTTYEEKENVVDMEKGELIDFIRYKNRKKALKSLVAINQITISKLINENRYQDLLNFIFSGRADTWMNEVQFNTLWNKLIGEKYVLTLTEYKDYSEWDMNKGEEVPVIQNYAMPINDKTYTFLKSLLLERGIVNEVTKGHGSDRLNEININNVKNVLISKMKKPKRLLQKDVAYFDYINTTELDLSRYQIYTQEQAYDNDNDNNCLINCFILSGVEDALVNQIKLSYVSGANIRNKDLPQMSKIIKRNIHMYTIDNNEKVRVHKVDNGFQEIVKIASYKNHAFLMEDSIYTRFFISNYDKLKDVDNAFDITRIKSVNGIDYYSRGEVYINTLQLIHLLYQQNYFIKSDLSMFEEAVNKTNNIYLDNIENEQELFVDEVEYDEDGRIDTSTYEKTKNFMEKCKKVGSGVAECHGKTLIYSADSETYVNGTSHNLFLLGAVGSSNDCVSIWKVNDITSPEEVVKGFMNYLTKGNEPEDKIICYFHNLKYDYHILERYLNMTGKVLKDNQVYSVKVRYFKYKIEFRDSYKLIPHGLGKFKKIFDLDAEFGKKEAIAYSYYTPENYGERVDAKHYRTLLKDGYKKTFDKNMETECTYDKKTNTFDPLSYYVEYLRLDCLTLKKGLEKFNTLILEITGDISIYHCLTISSLTDKYMIKNGAYDGVYSVKGNLREYISRAVYGGRVCVNEKYKKKVIEGKISDYDGVSLYPSAINRLCREIGIPTGEAKRVTNLSTIDYQYAILTIKINKVNKTQQIPFIAHKGDGVINYLNEPPPEPIIIDIITLQDYIKFHKIEYEILDGVYWEGNFNNKMGELVQTLFNERLKYKTSKPALAETIKLMLNSSYGKTIMKKSNTEIKIIKNQSKKGKDGEKILSPVDEVFESYVYNNFRTIKWYRKVNEYNYEIERLKVDDSNNRGHIGCAILSMSKRIMNEVFDIANDNGFPIYYSDTDSLHLNFEDVKPLEDKYREIYGKELNGKNLEQFHTDFSLDGAVDEIYATKSIFLGKKSYIDCLESKDKDGNTITGFHIRLKGITEEGMKYEASKYRDSYAGMYEDLANGNELNILLNPKDKVLFEYKRGFVATKGDFYRKVKF